jgi:hypothetical protein
MVMGSSPLFYLLFLSIVLIELFGYYIHRNILFYKQSRAGE